MTATRGFGVAGALDHSIVAQLAEAAEKSGYTAFWTNDTPGGDGLAALAQAAHVTTRIELGVGVIPVDRTSPARIAARIAELGLPIDRLMVGIGSGGAAKGTIEIVRNALLELRDFAGVRILVGALGPRMCRLGATDADGVLLNWLTPEAADYSTQVIRNAAAEVGRATPMVAAYVRTALPAGGDRLQVEADRYAGFPHYAAHFRRMGVAPIATTVRGDARAVGEGLDAFADIVDHVVVRAIVGRESLEEYLSLLDASRPELSGDDRSRG